MRKRFYPLWLFVSNKAAGLRIFRTEGARSLRNGLPRQRKRLEQAPSATVCLGRVDGWSKPQPYGRGSSFENGFILCGCLLLGKRFCLRFSYGWGLLQPYGRGASCECDFVHCGCLHQSKRFRFEAFVRLEQAPSAAV